LPIAAVPQASGQSSSEVRRFFVAIDFAVLRMIEMPSRFSRSWIVGPVLPAIFWITYRSRGLPLGSGIADAEVASTLFFFAAFGFFASLLPRF
jgi:hypothetical protein